MQSKKWDWNSADTKKFFEDLLRVSAPYLVVIIPVVISQIPDEVAWGVTVVWLLQRARVALNLFLQGK
jgi:hypothetical protein